MKALIFAAGLGTRLRPLTDTMPKALVPVAGHPLLEYQIRKLQSAGINDIIVNVHHFPDMIIDYLRENNNFGSNISISDERVTLPHSTPLLLPMKLVTFAIMKVLCISALLL